MNTSSDGFQAGFPESDRTGAAPDTAAPFQFPELGDSRGRKAPSGDGFAPLRFEGGRELSPDRPSTAEARRREAEKVLAEAREEAARIRAQAQEQGLGAGREAARTEAAELLFQLAQALEELGAARAALQRQAERGAVHLALAVAERVVAREVAADPDLILEVVRETLGQLDQPERLTLRVHPEAVARIDPAAIAAQAGTESVAVVPDAAISPGGCRVETGLGELDARMETRLEEMARALEARL